MRRQRILSNCIISVLITFFTMIATFSVGAETHDMFYFEKELKQLNNEITGFKSKDKFLKSWLHEQINILSRLAKNIKIDYIGGHTERSNSETRDFSVMVKRIRAEITFFQNATDLESNGRLNVKDFGAKGDGITDDTISIHKAITAALNGKIRTVFIPKGKYIVREHREIKPPMLSWDKTVPVVHDDFHPGYYGAILINGKNLLITGEDGSELVCSGPQDTVIHIVDSNNIRISNLKISYTKPSQVSGKIIGFASDDEVDVELEPGSGDPTQSYFRERGFKGLCRFYSEGHQPGSNRPKFSNDAIHQKFPKVSKISDNIYRFKFSSAFPLNKTYRIGQHMTYYARSYIDHAVVVYNSARVRLDKLHVYGSPAIAFYCFNSNMPFITNCKVEAMPGQYASTAADGVYFKSGWGGYISGNVFKYIGDDFINIHVRMSPVHRQDGNTIYLYMKTWPHELWESTKRLGYVLTSQKQCDLRGEFDIASYEPVIINENGKKLMLIKVTSNQKLPRFSTKTNLKKGELPDMISMPEYNWPGLVIDGNHFEHGVSRILFGGWNINITNNVFIDSLNSHTLGLVTFEPTASTEGRFCRNLMLAGNHFVSKAKTIISSKSLLKVTDKSTAERDRNIAHFYICDNNIETYDVSNHPLFIIDDVDYLTFHNNRIDAKDRINGPILNIQNSEHICINHNIARGQFSGFIAIEENNPSISCSNNKIEANGK